MGVSTGDDLSPLHRKVTLAELAMPPPPGSFTRGEAGVASTGAAEHVRNRTAGHPEPQTDFGVCFAGHHQFVHAALADGHFLLCH